jgi:hypothetical protein
MRLMWCWRCQMDIPMLEPDEVEQVFGLQGKGLVMLDPESFRQIHEEFAGDPDGLQKRLDFERDYGGMLREYERITGFRETEPMALYHHQVALYGPPCEWCGKPLRTPDAKVCGACGKLVSQALPQE